MNIERNTRWYRGIFAYVPRSPSRGGPVPKSLFMQMIGDERKKTRFDDTSVNLSSVDSSWEARNNACRDDLHNESSPPERCAILEGSDAPSPRGPPPVTPTPVLRELLSSDCSVESQLLHLEDLLIALVSKNLNRLI